MIKCDGCRFCCWSFNVNDVPDKIKGLDMKAELSHCKYECMKGCELHNDREQPSVCRNFKCPYLQGKEIYKPDTFQATIENLKGNVGNYIPAVPVYFDSEEVKRLIVETRAVPAFILFGKEWKEVILPLDKVNGRWKATKKVIREWKKLYK